MSSHNGNERVRLIVIMKKGDSANNSDRVNSNVIV